MNSLPFADFAHRGECYVGSQNVYEYLDGERLLDSRLCESNGSPIPTAHNNLAQSSSPASRNAATRKKEPMKSTWHNIPIGHIGNPFDPASVELTIHESLLQEPAGALNPPPKNLGVRQDRAIISLHVMPETTVPLIRLRAEEIVRAILVCNLYKSNQLIKDFGDIPAVMSVVELFLLLEGFDAVWQLTGTIGKLLLRSKTKCLLITSVPERPPIAVNFNEVMPGCTLSVRLDAAQLLSELVAQSCASDPRDFRPPHNSFYLRSA
ncbi:MAG TPA: hypothetical protein V6D17_03800 [Candidatus Obscuribacterales bacterium]